jgi:hypothetical protein
MLKKSVHNARPPQASQDSLPPSAATGEKQPEAHPVRYVEDCFDLRTKVGQGRVSARQG